LNRQPGYAESPILVRINELVLKGGDVRVAYVPRGCGKTTVCKAFLRTWDPPFGIAICVDHENSPSYAAAMLRQLGVRDGLVPEGWMYYLLLALEASVAEDAARRAPGWMAYLRDALMGSNATTPAAQNVQTRQRSPVLILDDFCNRGATTQDKRFLVNLKHLIRGTNVTVIVLTSNRAAADAMLTWNSMGSIIPLVSDDKVVEFRVKRRRDPTNWAMDWDKELSMVWSTSALESLDILAQKTTSEQRAALLYPEGY
jgi:hypothetical protein